MSGTANVNELALRLGGGPSWAMVRTHFDIQAFGVNAYIAEKPGIRIIEEHDELGERAGRHEELYFVASGRATFVLGDEEFDAPAGTFIYAEPGTKRGAVATEPNTTVLAIGAKPGVPHETSAWEEIFVAFGHYRNGDEDKARAHLTAFVKQNDDAWQGHYNLACFEALTKNRDAAIEELRRAIELDPTAKEYAANDTDFDWLRDDPDFPA